MKFYEYIITRLKDKIKFKYMVIDELYTYIKKKKRRYYVWAAIDYTSSGKKFYFYHLSKNKTTQALFLFNQELPQVNRVYSDDNFAYDTVYGNKAIQMEFLVPKDLINNKELKYYKI